MRLLAEASTALARIKASGCDDSQHSGASVCLKPFGRSAAGYHAWHDGAPGTPLLIQDQMGRGEHRSITGCPKAHLRGGSARPSEPPLVIARPARASFQAHSESLFSAPTPHSPAVCRCRRPAHSPLLVLPAICAHTQPLTCAALVPCSKSSRRTAVRAASSAVAHSWSVFVSPHTCCEVRPSSLTTDPNGVPA
jgi:hypothetical protein